MPRVAYGAKRGGRGATIEGWGKGRRQTRQASNRTVSLCQSRSCTYTLLNSGTIRVRSRTFARSFVRACVAPQNILSAERAHGANTFYFDLARPIETWATRGTQSSWR